MVFDGLYTYYGIVSNRMDDLDINLMGSLVIRNFRHGDKRSSLKLEAELWDALHEIVGELELSENKILSALADYKKTNNYEHGDGTFTSLVRVFIVNAIRKGINKLIHFRNMSGEDLSFFITAVFRA